MEDPAPLHPPQDDSTPVPITASSHLPSNIEQQTFGTIQLYPKEKIYENLENDEHIVLCLGRHWTQLVYPIIRTFFLMVIPLLAIYVYIYFHFTYPSIGQIIIFTWFWYCLVYYYLFSRIITWRSDIYIITNERIIDFDERSFFQKK